MPRTGPGHLTAGEPSFFLHVDDRVLWCLGCGSRARLPDQDHARAKAEAAHDCGLPCRCWSVASHRRHCDGS